MKLSDKYLLEKGAVYLTGIQTLVRLPMEQMRRDRRAGLNTACFISGYEGSPLGGYDLALQRVKELLAEHRVRFVPGVNEDLAATSVMGSQICDVVGHGKVDGVVGIWYGKGPGVDRSGDALRHANFIGVGRQGAALALAGDDHTSKSSTIPHQSDLSLYNLSIPTLCPGTPQEILDYGLYAIALSRFSGAWVALKLVTDVCDGGGTVQVDPERQSFRIPEGYQKKTDPRLVPPFSLMLEMETNVRRLDAARAFACHNRINRWFGGGADARLGIATAGKSYYDLTQALRDLGITESDLPALGLRIAKFGMTFPLEREFAREFARGLEAILVIEEKRTFLELQLRDALYDLSQHPAIIGKQDEHGGMLLPPVGELDPDTIARVVAPRLFRGELPEAAAGRLRKLEEIRSRPRLESVATRHPNYCSGCPHNRSTLLLDGQVAAGGIGCHGMGIMLADASRGYSFITHMGGEGAAWIGAAHFVDCGHIFQNIGDGTYFHSGALGVEACVAAGVNITFKILYNGHVAMTGGQEVTGALPVSELTRKLEAEGVRKIVVLAENVAKYRDRSRLAAGVEVRDRIELTDVLRELEKEPGVTALIYDQQCAAEKRRLRTRGKLEEPLLRLVIHEEICEGCGDCVKQSNCMSLRPVATEFGEKVRIHQSSCNKDYTCVLGDCPSFVTVKLKPGAGLRRRPLPQLPPAEVPQPDITASAEQGYRIVSPGIGGTGVVTINALLATAALLDGLSVATLDQTGLAQKGGAVVSHITLRGGPLETSAKVNAANADLILGFDLLGAAHPWTLRCADRDRTVAVVNTDVVPTAESVRKRTILTAAAEKTNLIDSYTRKDRNVYLDATRLAEGLFGSHLTVNIFLLGAAYQAGLIPLSIESLEEAIHLNGVEVERNLQAFLWGRKCRHDPEWVEQYLSPEAIKTPAHDPVELRAAELTAYQNAVYAKSYLDFVERVAARAPALCDAVARNLFKLMAYKDEYEVARLLTKSSFREQLGEQWESVESIGYNLHPPLLRGLGWKRKLKLGGWFRGPLRLLASLKFLRGTRFDVFGCTALRRQERSLIQWYRDLIEEVLWRGTPAVVPLALEIAALPDQIRGYEHIKRESIARVQRLAEEKLALLQTEMILR